MCTYVCVYTTYIPTVCIHTICVSNTYTPTVFIHTIYAFIDYTQLDYNVM